MLKCDVNGFVVDGATGVLARRRVGTRRSIVKIMGASDRRPTTDDGFRAQPEGALTISTPGA